MTTVSQEAREAEVTQADRAAAQAILDTWFNRSVIETILARHRQSAERGEAWRPIKTAPKDGTRIMVWSPKFGGKPVFAWWDTDKYAKRPIPRFITTDRIYGARDLFDVTHWQPLPTTPEAL